jgi:hypothetical protein
MLSFIEPFRTAFAARRSALKTVDLPESLGPIRAWIAVNATVVSRMQPKSWMSTRSSMGKIVLERTAGGNDAFGFATSAVPVHGS